MDHVSYLQKESEPPCLAVISTNIANESATPSESNRGQAVLCGAFRLIARQRLLLEGDRPVSLGSRALDILIALTKRPGDVVTKRELFAIVWPNTVVVENNLRVNIAALRRALRDGQDGNRYIVNIPGRGYCFVASVEFAEEIASLAPLANPAHGGRGDSLQLVC
jgi:DNA-binding winged helix-turn-helix (wHTH) protein